MATWVSIRNVQKAQWCGPRKVAVLQGLDLEIARGEFLAVRGPAGSGKTTLLNLLAGVDQPDEGAIRVGRQRIDGLSRRKLSQWRARHVGLAGQSPHLISVFSVEQNVVMPLLLAPLTHAQRRKLVFAALEPAGLVHCSTLKLSALSKGQQRRVAIAQALVSDPALLACDEPIADLDGPDAEEILTLLQILNEHRRKTIVLTCRDWPVTRFAVRRVHLECGLLRDSPAAQAF